MSLVEKRERALELNKSISKYEKELSKAEIKTKEATNEELIAQIEKDAEAVAKALDANKKELSEVNSEIQDEETALNEAAEQGEKSMANNKTFFTKSVDYLSTKQAMTDFAEVLSKNAGEDKDTVIKAWQDNLSQKGITNEEVLLPTAVVSAITDAFDKSELWALLPKTGLTVLKRAVNINTSATSRANGHLKGTDKKEQEITLVTKEVRAQYIYKYITLDKETLRENKDTNAIIKYVLAELPVQIINEIERAIVIGDGRGANDENKINLIEAVVNASTEDVTPSSSNKTGAFKSLTKLTASSDANVLDVFIDLDSSITAEGDRVLYMKRSFLAKLKKLKDTNGAFLFPFGTDLASVLGVKKIVTPSWMDESEVDAVEFALSAYELVGDTSIESYENFILAKNKHEYLQEIYVGGALTKREAAATITFDDSKTPVEPKV